MTDYEFEKAVELEEAKEIYKSEFAAVIERHLDALVYAHINEDDIRSTITEERLLHLAALRALCEEDKDVDAFINSQFFSFIRLFLGSYLIVDEYEGSNYEVGSPLADSESRAYRQRAKTALLKCYEAKIIEEVHEYLASYLEDHGYKKAS